MPQVSSHRSSIAGSDLMIRDAQSSDITLVTDLWQQLCSKGSDVTATTAIRDPERFAERVRGYLASGSSRVLVAELDRAVVGFAVLTWQDLGPFFDSPVVTVGGLYVQPEHEHKGIGRAFLMASLGEAERRGFGHVIATMFPGDRTTHRFFAKLGFTPYSSRRVVATSVLRAGLAGDEQKARIGAILSGRRALRRLANEAAMADQESASHSFGGAVLGDVQTVITEASSTGQPAHDVLNVTATGPSIATLPNTASDIRTKVRLPRPTTRRRRQVVAGT